MPRLQIQLGGEQLEQVDSFKYVGAKVTVNCTVGQEVQSRVVEAGRAMGGMKKIFKNREMGMGAKRGLYKSFIVPTVLYGAETWRLKAENKKRLDIKEMKCLRPRPHVHTCNAKLACLRAKTARQMGARCLARLALVGVTALPDARTNNVKTELAGPGQRCQMHELPT